MQVVAEAKTWVWEVFKYAMEKDFKLASKSSSKPSGNLGRKSRAWSRLF